jgi:pyruvate dehydrogenase E2 component (dihydrolipoamide acetyltransferase)
MAVSKVVMPKLSEAMETGKVIKWLKQEGDRVASGDILAEIETDKANVEMEAFGGGVLRKILVPEGGQAPVGSLIAVIAEPGDDIAPLVAQAGPATPPATEAKAPEAKAPETRAADTNGGDAKKAATPPVPKSEDPASRAQQKPEPAAPAVVTGKGDARSGQEARVSGAEAPPQPTAAPSPPAAPSDGRLRVSPLARKVAAESGLDLRALQGSGPGGRIVRRDVEAALAAPSGRPVAVAISPAATPGTGEAEYEDLALTPTRAAIAKRMPMSKAPVPHFYVTSEVAMDRAWELREELNGLEGRPRISVNDLVIRACALALVLHPGVNASFTGEAIRRFRQAHIGIAVALEDGLITPVLRNCEGKSLSQIAVEARDLSERARARKLRVTEMSGATFSISNLGMFDVEEFSAIINPPEGAILAVGSVREVPVVTPQGLAPGRRMKLTISCDHRVMDGAMGARFLQDVKRLLEEPLRLLV